jgi:SsrA-binding protein
MELKGTEVKSLRSGKANLKDSYAQVDNGELFIFNMHISPYEQGNRFNVDPVRPRKLLMHKKEIMRLLGKTKEKGLTLVPLKVYFTRGKAKIEIALAQGKKLYDKREAAAEKSAKRDIEKAIKEKMR